MTKKQDNAAQSQRFIQAARDLETDTSGKSFDRAMKKILPRSKPKKSPKHPT